MLNQQSKDPHNHQNSKKTINLVDGFAYEPQPHLPYPTCHLNKGFGSNKFALADFAFLSKVASTTDENTEKLLDEWFGSGVATNNIELINEFKSSSQYEEFNFGSAVSFCKFCSIDLLLSALI